MLITCIGRKINDCPSCINFWMEEDETRLLTEFVSNYHDCCRKDEVFVTDSSHHKTIMLMNDAIRLHYYKVDPLNAYLLSDVPFKELQKDGVNKLSTIVKYLNDESHEVYRLRNGAL